MHPVEEPPAATPDGFRRRAAGTRGALWTANLALAGRSGLALVAEDRGWQAALAARYGAFLVDQPGPGWPVLALESSETPPPTRSLLADLAASTVDTVSDQGSLTLEHPRFRVAIDRRRRRGALRGPRHRFPVDAVVRHLLAEEPGTLLVHGAVLVAGERAWVAAGDSGRGKTTLAGLLPECACCDELGLIEERDGGWQARSTPFWHGRPATGRLRAVHLLEHGASHRADRLAPAAAARELARQVVWPDWWPERVDAALERLARLVERVPVFRLRFRPDRDVLAVLEEAA